MSPLLKTTAALVLAAFNACTYAALLTAGSMSRTVGSQIIVDTLNNREWLGWDVVRDFSYAQTVLAVAPGGVFDGYRMANNVDAQKFVDALVGPNSCTATQLDWVPTCFTGEYPQWEDLVGESYLEFRTAVGAPGDHEAVKFLNWSGGVGYLDVLVHDITADVISKGNNWETITGSDRYTGAESFGWLLFRETPTMVSEPSSSLLIAVGLLSLLATRRQGRIPG